MQAHTFQQIREAPSATAPAAGVFPVPFQVLTKNVIEDLYIVNPMSMICPCASDAFIRAD